jgi:ankyrin repeat protein
MAFHGNVAGAALVLDAGASADAPDGVFGPIHTGASPLSSARFGAAPMLRLLLAHGARIESTNTMGLTALHRVASSGSGLESLLAAHVLVEAGASADARDREGRTPLDLAAAEGPEGEWTARYLRGDAAARALAVLLDAVDRGDAAAVEAALPSVADLDAGAGGDAGVLHSGGTVLHLAAVRGHAPLVPLLADAGASVQAVDTRGTTPLYAAAARGDLATVRALLDAGAHPDGPDAWPFMGMRPLHEAASSGSVEVVRALLDADADALYAMSGGFGLGYDALGFAIAGGHADVVRLLLDADFDPNRMGDTEETPLDLARSLHLDAIAAMLLDAGAIP